MTPETEAEMLRRLSELEARAARLEARAIMKEHERYGDPCWCGIRHFPHATWTLPVSAFDLYPDVGGQ
jgi:hypothetical protein